MKLRKRSGVLFFAGIALTFHSLLFAATPMPKEVVINDVEFIYIPEGRFWHAIEPGREANDLRPNDKKDHWFAEHRIWQDDFYIAKYEARARHFKKFMEQDQVAFRDQYEEGEEEGCSVQRNDRGDYFLVNAEREMPATHLSWQLADEFATWMGFRLPTEAEWVKAARGTDRRMFPWGNEEPDDTFAAFNSGSSCNSTDIKSFRKGMSPYGVYNMAGNVYEFVQDWYNVSYDLSLKEGTENPVSDQEGSVTELSPEPRKILKGGRWASTPEGLNVFSRSLRQQDSGFVCFGARFVVDTDTVREHLAAGTATVVQP